MPPSRAALTVDGSLYALPGDERHTLILVELSEFSVEDLIADENMVVTVSNEGYIKRLPVSTYRKQRRVAVERVRGIR